MWDVSFEPTQQGINDFSMQSSFNVEKFFSVNVENDNMYFVFGQSGKIEFATNIGGVLSNTLTWEIKRVFDILKMSSDAECSMSFSDKGVLKITLNSGLAEYGYMLPARSGS